MSSSESAALTLSREAIDRVVRLGGAELLERLVAVAEDNFRRRLEEWRQALEADPPDAAAAERAAHSIKSSAAYVGVEVLRRVAAGMEESAREGRLAGLDPSASEVRELLAAALPLLQAEVRRRSGTESA